MIYKQMISIIFAKISFEDFSRISRCRAIPAFVQKLSLMLRCGDNMLPKIFLKMLKQSKLVLRFTLPLKYSRYCYSCTRSEDIGTVYDRCALADVASDVPEFGRQSHTDCICTFSRLPRVVGNVCKRGNHNWCYLNNLYLKSIRGSVCMAKIVN